MIVYDIHSIYVLYIINIINTCVYSISLPLLKVQPSFSFNQEGHAVTVYCCIWFRALTFSMIFSGQ